MSTGSSQTTTSMFSQYPSALLTYHEVGLPNAFIPLYHGIICGTQDENSFQADCQIQLEWLPQPTIRYNIPQLPDDFIPSGKELNLKIADGTKQFSDRHPGFTLSSDQKSSFSGSIHEYVILPKDAPVNFIKFLMPNFPSVIGRPILFDSNSSAAARLEFETEVFRITIDQVQECYGTLSVLKTQSGYGITHIGRLERKDDQAFTFQDCTPILEALGWYLSFAVGRWTGTCLPTGHDASGQLQWQSWFCSRLSPFNYRISWLDSHYHEHLEQPFSKYFSSGRIRNGKKPYE